MTIEIILLILESLLLGFTIILLLFSIKEGRGRKGLLLKIRKMTKVLSRQEYFLAIIEAMFDTQKELFGIITGRPPSEDDTKRINIIIKNIERLSKKGVSIKYILPKLHDRIHIGSLYSKAGAIVRYGTCCSAHDFRYIVVDNSFVVMGIPDNTGDKEATRKGHRIATEEFSKILGEHFSRCWEESIEHGNYIEEVVKQSGVSLKVLAKELQISEEDLMS